MTLTEHQKKMCVEDRRGTEFNECMVRDKENAESLEEALARFERERKPARIEDFSGMLSSCLLEDIPYVI